MSYIPLTATASIAASTTQTQGQGQLTYDVNEIGVCANDYDTVTLPSVAGGKSVVVINNGAKTLQVFPPVGGNLGMGLNASTTVNSGEYKVFTCYAEATLTFGTNSRDFTITDVTPVLNFKDVSCADSDINASIQADATATGAGAENIDVTFQQQVSGTLTTYISADADGNLTLGKTGGQTVATTGALQITGGLSGITTLGLTQGITLTPTVTGTLFQFQLETEWTQGTLINAGFGGATIQDGNMIGICLDFNTNMAGVTDHDVFAIQVKMPALTQSTANTTMYTGYEIFPAGALVQDTLAGTINWKGVNINMPNITQTTGTINSYGIYVNGGTVTSGTEYAIFVDSGYTRLDGQTAINMGGVPSASAVLTVGWNNSTMAAGTTAARHFYTTGNITELTGAVITDIVGAYFNTFTITDGGGAETVGIVATVYIPNAPTVGTTPTNGPYALFIDDGAVRIDGTTTFGGTVNAITFDTNVVAAGVTLSGTTLLADGTDANIDISITPKGTGEVNLSKVDIDAGTIDGTTIATSDITVGAGKTLNVSAGTLTLADNQISGDKVEGGTINAITITTLTSTTVNGTTFDTNVVAAGVTLAGTTLGADGTDVNIDISITPKGSGEVNLSKVDIDAGAIDGTTIGANTAANITGLIITASTNFSGALTGNVTGNCSGSSGSCTGNAATVTNGVYTTDIGTVTAKMLQNAGADLGDADITIDLSNTNAGNVTNLTIDGVLTAVSLVLTGAISGITTLNMAGDLTDYEAVNDGNPEFRLGATDAEELHIQSIYDSGAQTLNYVQITTDAASAVKDKGKYVYNVDGVDIFQIRDKEIYVNANIQTQRKQFIDDIYGSIKSEWATRTTTGSRVIQNTTGGWYRLTTGALATNEESIDWNDICPFVNTRQPSMIWAVKLEQVTNIECEFGLIESAAVGTNDYIRILFDASVANTWGVEVATAGATSADAGAVATTNETWFKVEFTSDTAIEWFISTDAGATWTSQGTVASNVPTVQLQPYFAVRTEEAGAHYAEISSVQIAEDRV